MTMWYFFWILGVGFAVLLAILNAMWGESEEDRAAEARSGARTNQGSAAVGRH
jgi:cyd operon protein YbgT